MLSRTHAKRTLKSKGWSYRRAAPLLGVSYVHLAKVLGGHRESRRLLMAIASLPDCHEIPGNSPYRRTAP
jgi:hypothetical protein